MQGDVKICSKCGSAKPVDEYYMANRTGKRGDCKDCSDFDNRKRVLKREYNLTLEDFDNMKEKQNSQCAICNRKTELHVDHCHNSGKVRGLLCRGCNTAIGLLGENIFILSSAIRYLKQHNGIKSPDEEYWADRYKSMMRQSEYMRRIPIVDDGVFGND